MSPRVNLSYNPEAGGLNTGCPFQIAVAVCAVCAKGFTPGLAYSCHDYTGGKTRPSVGLAVAVCVVMLLFSALLVSRLWSVAHK